MRKNGVILLQKKKEKEKGHLKVILLYTILVSVIKCMPATRISQGYGHLAVSTAAEPHGYENGCGPVVNPVVSLMHFLLFRTF